MKLHVLKMSSENCFSNKTVEWIMAVSFTECYFEVKISFLYNNQLTIWNRWAAGADIAAVGEHMAVF